MNELQNAPHIARALRVTQGGQKKLELRGIRLSASDLRELFEVLSDLNNRAVELQLALEIEQMPDENRHAYIKNELEPCRKVHFEIRNGLNQVDRHFFPDKSPENYLAHTTQMFINTSGLFAELTNGRQMDNRVTVFLDFQTSKVSDVYTSSPATRTNDNSNIEISSTDDEWLALAEKKVQSFVAGKSKKLSKVLHSGGTYDGFLWLVFVPIGVWIGLKIEPEVVKLIADYTYLGKTVVLVVAVLAFFNLAKLTFGFLRWLNPLVEIRLDGEHARGIWRNGIYAILIGLLGSAIWSALQFIFT